MTESAIKDRIKKTFMRISRPIMKKDFVDIRGIEWGELINIEKLCIALKVEEQMKSFPQSFIKTSLDKIKDIDQRLEGVSAKENNLITSVQVSTPPSATNSTQEQVRPGLEVRKVSLPPPLVHNVTITDADQNSESRTQSRCEAGSPRSRYVLQQSNPSVSPNQDSLPVMVNTHNPSAVTSVSEKLKENVPNDISRGETNATPRPLNANSCDNLTSVSALNNSQVLSSRVLETNSVHTFTTSQPGSHITMKDVNKRLSENLRRRAVGLSGGDVCCIGKAPVQPRIQEAAMSANIGVLSGVVGEFNGSISGVSKDVNIGEQNLTDCEKVQVFVSTCNLVTVQIPKNYIKFCKATICNAPEHITPALWPTVLLITSQDNLVAVKLHNVFRDNIDNLQSRIMFNLNAFKNTQSSLLHTPLPLRSVWIRSTYIITVFQCDENGNRDRQLTYEDQRQPKSTAVYSYILEQNPINVPATTPNCNLTNLVPDSVVTNSVVGPHITNSVNDDSETPPLQVPTTQLLQTDDLPEIGNEDKTGNAEIDSSCELSDMLSSNSLVPEVITIEDDCYKSTEFTKDCDVQTPEECMLTNVDTCKPAEVKIDSETLVMEEETKTTSTEMDCNEVCNSSEVRSDSASEASSSETEDVSESLWTADHYIQNDPKLLQAQIIIEDIENDRFEVTSKDRPRNRHKKRLHLLSIARSRKLRMYKSSKMLGLNTRSKSVKSVSRTPSSLAVREPYKTRSCVNVQEKLKVVGVCVNGHSMPLCEIKTELQTT